MSQSISTSHKLIIKKPGYDYNNLKKVIEQKLNKLYPTSQLYDLELNYATNSPTMLVEGMIVGCK